MGGGACAGLAGAGGQRRLTTMDANPPQFMAVDPSPDGDARVPPFDGDGGDPLHVGEHITPTRPARAAG